MREIRSDSLKLIAIICMFIDHIGGGIVERYLLVVSDPNVFEILSQVNSVLRGVGRLAMPIFCYQIVMGMMYTRSREKYLRNLLLFGVLSELPYDLLFQGRLEGYKFVGSLYDMKSQNVFFTLFLGASVIYLYELLQNKLFGTEDGSESEKVSSSDKVMRICKAVSFIAITVLASYIAERIKCDYGAKGVLLIAIFYLFRFNREQMCVYGVVLFLAEIVLITFLRTHNWMAVKKYFMSEAYACLAFPMIYADNGKRIKSTFLKWAGYAFYPVHILLIYIADKLIFR